MNFTQTSAVKFLKSTGALSLSGCIFLVLKRNLNLKLETCIVNRHLQLREGAKMTGIYAGQKGGGDIFLGKGKDFF